MGTPTAPTGTTTTEPDRAAVVLKFGGTSVSSLARWRTIAAAIRERLDEGLRPQIGRAHV